MAGRRNGMIELTHEQVEALANPDATPPRVVNPETQETYVLLPLPEYERLLRDEEYDDAPWTEEEMELLREESCRMLDSFGKNE
jgi:hypothetical protein